MWTSKHNWRKTIIGGVVASGVLIILLFCFVHTNLLAGELAVPWITGKNEVQAMDWTCLFFASFATASFIAYYIPGFNWQKGILGGILLALILTIACSLAREQIFGIGYYFICYFVAGGLFGRLITSKKHLIIRRWD